MKRRYLSACLGALCAAGLLTSLTASADVQTLSSARSPGAVSNVSAKNAATTTTTGSTAAVSPVSAKKAQQIALEHAGLTAKQVSYLSSSLDNDDGVSVYKVKFWKGSASYSYEISVDSGRILELDYQIGQADALKKQTAASSSITPSKAQSIALAHAGVKADDATLLRVEAEKDDGLSLYDVTFWKDDVQYDYEILAATGDIYSFDYEVKHFVSASAIPEGSITPEQAKKIAMEQAGLSENTIATTKVESDEYKGRQVYNIKFTSGNVKYSYVIDAATGKIVSFDYKVNSEAENASTNTSSVLTPEEARTAALKAAGQTAANVSFTKTKLDNDDGRLIYEIKFWNNRTEYDFDIDAFTGQVLSYDFDGVQPSNANGNVTLEQAKAAALAYAGLSGSNVTFTKTEMDNDDGRQIYELKFQTSQARYEADVDAATGKVVEYDYKLLKNTASASTSAPASSGQNAGVISLEQAKTAALQHAKLSAGNATFTKTKLDNDDGRQIYELEFVSASREYDYEVDAATGKILEWESEPLDD